MGVFIAVVGMHGSGKSHVCDYIKKRNGFQFVRFGQITLDLAKGRWEEVDESKEKIIRGEMREKHGMAAFATLNMDKFNAALEKGNLVGDGMRSFEELIYLREQFGDNLVVLGMVAGMNYRHGRVTGRKRANDEKMRYRSTTIEAAKSRDFAELENMNLGPTIAMADYYITNQGSLDDLDREVDTFIEWVRSKGFEI